MQKGGIDPPRADREFDAFSADRDGTVVKNDKILSLERPHGIGVPLVIAELDLENIGVQNLDHSSHLSGHELTLRIVSHQGDYI